MRDFNLGPHLGKRRHDARHRTPRERLIPAQLAGKWLAGKNSAQHAHGRAGVSAIEDLRGSVQPRPHAMHFNRSVAVFVFVLPALPLAAELADAVERAGAIARR